MFYCIDCALKHLGDALIFYHEFRDANTAHDVLCMASLNQAACHLRDKHPDVARLILEERKAFEKDRSYEPAIWESILSVYDLWTQLHKT